MFTSRAETTLRITHEPTNVHIHTKREREKEKEAVEGRIAGNAIQ